MSKYLREFYHSIRMTTFIFFTKSTVFASFASFIFISISKSDILFWSFFLCICLFANDSKTTQNFRSLYHEHTNSNFINVSRCNWYQQAKKAQEIYHVRKHELTMKSKIKQKTKKLLKQQKKIRLIKKRIEKYICKRCKNKTIKFDNNIKFHEHIRTRHVKKSKSKSAQQFVEFVVSFFISFVSSFRSIIFSFFLSSKFLFFSISTSEIVRERSENVSSKFVIESLAIFSKIFSEFLSIETSKKSIFWTEIVSRSIVASKFSRFSIATSKSIYNILKKFAIRCSFVSSISFQTFTSSKFYLIVNDLFRMFVEKSNSFDLQRHQMRSSFSRDFDKRNFANKCDFIQNCITSYFHATISFASKSIKFEIFESTHVRENFSRQFSIFSSISFIWFRSFRFIFRFSMIFRSVSVCRHCQKRFVIYWFIDWIMSNVFKIENNEIFMKQRYWSFASSRSILRKYWFLFDEITTLKKLTCCLFICFAFLFRFYSSLIDHDLKKHKNCCCFNEIRCFAFLALSKSEKAIVVCFVYLFIVSRICRNLFLWFRFDLTRLIVIFFFTIFEI